MNFVPSRSIHELAAEYLEIFDRLYAPIPYLERVYGYCRKLSIAPRNELRRWRQHSGIFIGVLVLCWRQGVIRESRWIFWKYLAQICIFAPQVLDEYLWLLMLEEHFLDYKEVVRSQVQKQLDYCDAEMVNVKALADQSTAAIS